MLNTPLSPWPSYSRDEADAVTRQLMSNRVNYWTGSECRDFEDEFAEWVGSSHAVAVSNGTQALEIALRALGIGSGDDVIVSPRSFIASASCVVALGASPVFADVDFASQNITAQTISDALTPNTRAIICVHLAGRPCDMDSIMSLAEEKGLLVLEDCAQAHGAEIRGQSVGSIGHVAAWSFCQDKIMTTGGEGGMITTSDEELRSRIWSYKDHGKSWDAVYHRDHPPGFRWVHESFGTNARMLEYQAVIGRIQLQRMPEWRQSRNDNASRLAEACRPHEVVAVPELPSDFVHAYYRFTATVNPKCLAAGWSRNRVIEELTTLGVPCFEGSCAEIYREKAFDDSGFRPDSPLPVAQRLGQESIALLVHPTLTPDEVTRSCEVIDDVLRRASR